MNKNKTVTINGQQYDALTGLPVGRSSDQLETVAVKPANAGAIHGALQKSQTLIRRTTKKPIAKPTDVRRTPGRSMDIARSDKIARFAPHPVKPAPKKEVEIPDVKPQPHPIAQKAQQKQAVVSAPVATAQPTLKQTKNDAITAALAKPAVKSKKRTLYKKHPRFFSIVTVSVIIALLGAYLTYMNLPSWSVRVAATQAGIDATYPEYRPDGYRVDGPVTFSDGEVTIPFGANTGTTGFTIKQVKSSWDSTAVLDSIVRKKVGEEYITSQERGLTIYTYNGNAAWVNAGILYTIDGDAPLSGEQIRRIATSL